MEDQRGNFPEILHFNTNRQLLNRFTDMLDNHYDIVSFHDISSISNKGNNGFYDLLLLSYNSLKDCKIRCLEEIKTLYPSVPVMLYGHDITPNAVRDFFITGVDEFLVFDENSPLCKDKILDSINRLVDKKCKDACSNIERALRESEEKLREQNKHNILRARIWELAADKSLSDNQLFHNLLKMIGQEFDVDRACFNIFREDTIECIFEWCNEGVTPSLGTKLPSDNMKYLITKEFLELSKESAIEKLPESERFTAKILIDNLIEELNLEKVIVIPCHINGNIEGTITLDLCAGHGESFEWTDDKKRVMMDCVKIITQSISNKRMESRVLETEAIYSAIVGHATDGIVIIRHGVFEFVNRALLKMTGYLSSDIMGKPFLSFVCPEHQQAFEDRISNYPDSKEIPLPSSIKILKKDGNIADMEISYSYIKYMGKSAIMGILRDITQRREMERELLAKNRELNDFAYMISHDLKNPLIIINGYLNIIKDKPELFDLYYNKVLDSSSRLISYISNLLELSRSGKIISDKNKINMSILYNEVYKIVKPEELKSELIINNPELVVHGDYDRIKQLIINLFQNAIRYRDKNKEKLIIETSGRLEKDSVYICVKDNGSGITREYLDKVFKAGYTGDKTIGTGFGLAISRKIIEAHGGKIWVESEGENKGAKFCFRIPL